MCSDVLKGLRFVFRKVQVDRLNASSNEVFGCQYTLCVFGWRLCEFRPKLDEATSVLGADTSSQACKSGSVFFFKADLSR